MIETRSLQVKSGKTTIDLTFNNDVLSIGKTEGKGIVIPSRNVLDVTLKDSSEGSATRIDIHALVPCKGHKLRLKFFNYEVIQSQSAAPWIELVKNAAYQNVKPNKHLKTFINPFGGTGKAKKIFEQEVKPIFDAAGCTYDIIVTGHKDDAKEKIIEDPELQKYDAIVTVSGDGVIYEIINGLLSREDASDIKIPIGVIPAGSGNALNTCLHGETTASVQHAALTIIKGVSMDIDICSVTQGDNKYFSFLSQTYGMVADCDIETENLRWLGDTRFTIGILRALMEGRRYGCEIAVKFSEKNKDVIKESYKNAYAGHNGVSDVPSNREIIRKYGTVNDPIPKDWEILPDSDISIFYGGKVPWVSRGNIPFPCVLPGDGLLDLLIVNRENTSKLKLLSVLLKMEKATHINADEVQYYKVEAFRLTPKNREAGYISIDGERVPFEPFQVEVHKKLISVLSVNGKYHYVDV